MFEIKMYIVLAATLMSLYLTVWFIANACWKMSTAEERKKNKIIAIPCTLVLIFNIAMFVMTINGFHNTGAINAKLIHNYDDSRETSLYYDEANNNYLILQNKDGLDYWFSVLNYREMIDIPDEHAIEYVKAQYAVENAEQNFMDMVSGYDAD